MMFRPKKNAVVHNSFCNRKFIFLLSILFLIITCHLSTAWTTPTSLLNHRPSSKCSFPPATLCFTSFSSSNYYSPKPYSDDEDDDDPKAEFVDIDDEDDEQEWLSDRELVRRAAATPGGEMLTNRDKNTLQKLKPAGIVDDEDIDGGGGGGGEERNGEIVKRTNTEKKSVYTKEEEELINVMGGKDKKSSQHRREPGYLGDSTLNEIAMDFSVPICYIADVLVTWGSPIPIDPNMRLGDLVTGEQAFALLEAIHTLDVSDLQDRYSNDDMMTVADECDIDLKEAFEYAMRKGWSLPFGVRTCLRVEQEDELIQALGTDDWY